MNGKSYSDIKNECIRVAGELIATLEQDETNESRKNPKNYVYSIDG